MTDHEIRYVCLSDMHLGDEDSLLTSLRSDRYECDQSRASPILVEVLACIRDLVSRNPGGTRPTLVLNGDILELAFASYSQSLAMLDRMLQLCISPGDELFDQIIYVPGNHDHHIWEVARETQFVTKVLRERTDEGLPPPMHATPMTLAGSVPSYLLNQIVRHVRGIPDGGDPDFDLHVVYPNLALVDDSGERCVVLHHGHYVEPLFQLISRVRRRLFPHSDPPVTVAELEAENFAWIDFVWSVLGRSGRAGAHAEVLYKKLQYPEHVEDFVDELAERIAQTTDIPFVPGEWLERKLLRATFSHVARKIQGPRKHADHSVTDEIGEGLRKYVFEFVYRQLSDELGHIPDELSFVFGHTHKPFAQDFEGPFGRAVHVHNTGGWAVDSAERSVGHGASIALISGELDVVSVHVHDEMRAHGAAEVLVPAGAPDSVRAFAAAVTDRIRDAGESPWQECAVHIAEASDLRRRHLHAMFRDRS